ncbi:hypothetical protein [Pseudogemmobacter bohemicus]|uniref:hypothetical protein n=1 Tax=Pseudogemmobacter bohemicus TaxID=2250708 RepID=UPI0013009FDA|nr:hypothetical protein [Pseudogemmobacter bohemicus]
MGLIESYARRAELGLAPDTLEIALSERLIHAAAFQFGLVIEIIIGALEIALLECGDHLEWRHFKLAYAVRSSCADAFNPFVVDDDHRIDTRRSIKREDERRFRHCSPCPCRCRPSREKVRPRWPQGSHGATARRG